MKNTILRVLCLSVCVAFCTRTARGEETIDVTREIEACNLLTKYLCVLEDLQGRGFLIVRRELVDNVNTSGLSDDSKRLFRRLLDTCDHAETTLDSLGYVREDASEKWGQALGNSVGWSAGVSLATGDITPLLEGAAQLTRHGIRIEKEKSRELRVIVQSYLQLLSKVQFEVNSRRGDLVHENDVAPNLFITKSLYESFLLALATDDPSARASALQAVCTQCPSFREVQYYLADALHRTGDLPGAVALCASLVKKSNPILQRDGFLGEVKADLGFYLLQQGKLKESLEWSKASLADKPANAVAYNNIAVALMNLKQYEEAGENWVKCIELLPDHAWFWWTGARIAAASKEPEDMQLILLRAALLKGFDDFEAINSFRQLTPALKTPFGRHLLRPQLDVQIDFDLINDDLYFTNSSHFPLSDVRGKAKFTFTRGDYREKQTVEASFRIASLLRGEEVCVADVASMPESRRIRIELSYTCDQYTGPREQSYFYNWLGEKNCLEHDSMLNSFAWWVYVKRDYGRYDDALQAARNAVDYSLRQKPHILDTLAWLCYERGDKDMAKQLMDEAIQLLDRDNETEKAKQYRERRQEMK